MYRGVGGLAVGDAEAATINAKVSGVIKAVIISCVFLR